MGDQGSLSGFYRDIGIPINFQEESSLVSFGSLELHEPLEVSMDVRPPVQMTWLTRVYLGSPHRIQTSLHLVR